MTWQGDAAYEGSPFFAGEVEPCVNMTICVLEALLEHERACGGTREVIDARLRGREYLLELRGLDYLQSAGVAPDGRVAEAIALVASKRDGDGRWPLERVYPGVMPIQTDAGEGLPSRWNTLRALRVLKWYSPSATG